MNTIPHYETLAEAQEAHPNLGFFGWRKQDESWRPILWRPKSWWARCVACQGFGSSGAPMVGVMKVCESCGGTGHNVLFRCIRHYA